jgi:hypothetical protein
MALVMKKLWGQKMYDEVIKEKVVSTQLNTVTLTTAKYFTKTLKRLPLKNYKQ